MVQAQPRITRPAAVAGQFYPDDPRQLGDAVVRLLSSITLRCALPKALVVPHAGYIYSGAVAAAAFASLAANADSIRRVVLLGPSHRVAFRGLALTSAQYYSTPLGPVCLDTALARQLLDSGLAHIDDRAHAYEHSLEVQLPFLQTVLHDFTLLPVVVGAAEPETVARALTQVTAMATLILISTDLSHYCDYATATELDSLTSQAIVQRRTDLTAEQACGHVPLNGLLHYACEHELHVSLLDRKNSGDTAGPRNQVVGYGAYALH